jgi:hypothetical protein
MAPDSLSQDTWPLSPVIRRHGTLTAPSPCNRSSRCCASCWASRFSIGKARLVHFLAYLDAKRAGSELVQHDIGALLCSALRCCAGAGCTAAGRLKRSHSSMNGPSTHTQRSEKQANQTVSSAEYEEIIHLISNTGTVDSCTTLTVTEPMNKPNTVPKPCAPMMIMSHWLAVGKLDQRGCRLAHQHMGTVGQVGLVQPRARCTQGCITGLTLKILNCGHGQ